jgi:hypothetical protein
MIAHPVGNRALLLGFVIPQIFGSVPDDGGGTIWLIVGINLVLIGLVVAGWRTLKLDRNSG